VLDRMRNRLGVKNIRRAVQAKVAGTVDEVLTRHLAAQDGYIDERLRKLEHQLAEVHEELRRLIGRTVDRVGELEMRTRRDITFAGEQHAALEAACYAREHMTTAKQCGHPHETLEYALTLAPSGGMALEFGVASGTTLKIISSARNGERVFGFDSFNGLPTDWRSGFLAGMFQVDEPPEVPGAELVVGMFDDTLPGFLDQHEGIVDFLHIDSDLYSSAKTVLDQVGPRLRAGSVIVFDEFFNYPAWRQHEYRAWTEHVESTGITFEYKAYSWDNEQVVVQLTSV
jgi:hypothetical protein